MKAPCVYILLCADESYYTGVTSNMEERFGRHQSGEIPNYVASRLPVKLVFSQHFPDMPSAIAAEKQIKGWSRAKKEALIAGNYDLLHQLATCTNVTNSEAQVLLKGPSIRRRNRVCELGNLPRHPSTTLRVTEKESWEKELSEYDKTGSAGKKRREH